MLQLLPHRLEVLVVDVQVHQGREVLQRRRHVPDHLVFVQIERDEAPEAAKRRELGEVAVELVVLHPQMPKR